MALRKPCIDCGRLTEESRCPAHAKASDTARAARRGSTTERMGSGWGSLRVKVIKRDGGVCVLCHLGAMPNDPLNVDHIIRREHDGTNSSENLRTLHRSANRARQAGDWNGRCKWQQ